MFLIRWIRKLLSLPLEWAGLLANMFKQPFALPLFQAAYAVNGDGQTALAAVQVARARQGPEAAQAMSEHYLSKKVQPETAAIAGLLAIDRGDLPAAGVHLDQARSSGADRTGLVDMLALFAGLRNPDDAVSDAVALEMAARSDVLPIVSKTSRMHLLWRHLQNHDFDQARNCADRLLAVEDNPQAYAVLWAIERNAGRGRQAQSLLAKVKLPAPQRLYSQAMGLACIGDFPYAREIAAQIPDQSLAQTAGNLIDRQEARK